MNGFVSLERKIRCQFGHLHTESDSNVLRIAAIAAWFSDALVDFNFSTENRQFLY